jgi:hypothetical protein
MTGDVQLTGRDVNGGARLEADSIEVTRRALGMH